MSRYPRVKPRPKQHSAAPAPVADEALTQDARKLYRLKGGEFIEASIKRLERLLVLHDREMAQLESEDVTKKRWLVSPSMVLRLQRELERYQAIRADLIEQVFRLAAPGANASDVPQVTQPEPEQHGRPGGQERGQAEPAVTAAA